MSVQTRIDIIALQFNRGLRCAGCSEGNVTRITQLIKQKKIDAISLFASEDGFKVCELIISIDWNEYKKHTAETGSIGGLQKTGETIEVETYLDDLVKKSEEKQLQLSYWISFSGALRIREAEEYYRLKKRLEFEDNIIGWMNSIGRDEVDSIPDLPEIKIRIRDIQEVNAQDRSLLQKKKVLLSKCRRVSEQLIRSKDEKSGDYYINYKEFPVEITLTFQGAKKAANLLNLTTLNDSTHEDIKQGIIICLVDIEENRIIDEKAAGEVEELIDKIGKVTYTEECEKKIRAARFAFSNLTVSQRLLVPEDRLRKAESEYDALKRNSKEKQPLKTGNIEEDQKKRLTIAMAVNVVFPVILAIILFNQKLLDSFINHSWIALILSVVLYSTSNYIADVKKWRGEVDKDSKWYEFDRKWSFLGTIGVFLTCIAAETIMFRDAQTILQKSWWNLLLLTAVFLGLFLQNINEFSNIGDYWLEKDQSKKITTIIYGLGIAIIFLLCFVLGFGA